MPGNATILVFCCLDRTLQSAVGVGVLLVEIQIAFVAEEALSRLRVNVLNVLGRHYSSRELDKVLPSWF